MLSPFRLSTQLILFYSSLFKYMNVKVELRQQERRDEQGEGEKKEKEGEKKDKEGEKKGK